MFRFRLIALSLVWCAAAVVTPARAQDHPPEPASQAQTPQTGAFKTTFDEPRPHSDAKELARRLGEALDYLDAGPATAPESATQESMAASASAKPATRPAAAPSSEAKQMLNMARNYINARKYKEARARLKSLIEKYPSSPEAAEAQKLLSEIEGK